MLMLDDAVLAEPEHLEAFKVLLRAGYLKPYRPAPVALPTPKRRNAASPKPKKASKMGWRRYSAMTGNTCDQCGNGKTPYPATFTGAHCLRVYGMNLCRGCQWVHIHSLDKGLTRTDEITW